MNVYFEEYFIKGNEYLFWAFIAIIIIMIGYTIYAVRKEIRK